MLPCADCGGETIVVPTREILLDLGETRTGQCGGDLEIVRGVAATAAAEEEVLEPTTDDPPAATGMYASKD